MAEWLVNSTDSEVAERFNMGGSEVCTSIYLYLYCYFDFFQTLLSSFGPIRPRPDKCCEQAAFR
jgi:hypothetical protein